LPIVRTNLPDNKLKDNNSISLYNYLKNIGDTLSSVYTKSEWVSCELVAFNNNSGNFYFELVDTSPENKRIRSVSAILYRSKANSVISNFENSTGMKLTSGMKLLVQLKVGLKPEFGMSFVLDNIDPNYTVGEMEAKANAIRKNMVAKNIHNNNRNLKTPTHFSSIAVISPSGAAGLGDFKVEADILERNNLCKFTYFSATFEGNKTEDTIVKAFSDVHYSGLENYDCIVFIRGGGAKSSLQFLNEQKIIHCICKIQLPVFIGVGHEKDKVLADEFGNVSFDTPSKVIEYITNTIFYSYSSAEQNILDINTIISNTLSNIENNINSLSQNIFSGIELSLSNYIDNVDKTSYSIFNGIEKSLLKYESDINYACSDISSGIDNYLERSIMNIESNSNYIENIIYNRINHYKSEVNFSYDSILNSLVKNIEFNVNEINYTYDNIAQLNPYKILENGYAIVKVDDNVVVSVKDIKDGFDLIMKDGTIHCSRSSR
jgi:exodeoxyribonuclease VII large subunit